MHIRTLHCFAVHGGERPTSGSGRYMPVEKKSYDPPAYRSTDRAAYSPFQICADIPEI